MLLRRPLAALALLLLSTVAATPQGALSDAGAADAPASLVADRILINPDNTLVADGAVEVLYKGQRLTARRISFDETSDKLMIEGPLTLNDGKGTVTLASSAELTSDFREGVLRSARVVLDDRLQIAAQQMDRVEGRYTQLSRVVASSCQVCPSNPRPLWEIRASRVVHDAEKRQLYYSNAQFRVAGIPLFWAPRLRMPDPSVNRADGFLIPSLQSSTALGFGIKVPYFKTLGDNRDLLVAPLVTVKGNYALNLRYRQAFRSGYLTFEGAIGHDHVINRDKRGYLFGYGNFNLPRDFRLGVQVETVTDDGYLLDYNITDKDRLGTGAYIQRTRRDEYFDARFYKYRSLRQGDVNDILPTLVGNIDYIRHLTPPVIGGVGQLRFNLESIGRTSNVSYDANGDGVTDGRDMTRAGISGLWQRQGVIGPGLVLSGGAGLALDGFFIRQDASYPSNITRWTPLATAQLRWPLVRSNGRSTDIIEPRIQVVWSHVSDSHTPDEDSAFYELDEGNLFSFSRFPGHDVYETGLRANVGLSWTRLAENGWKFNVASGRIFRQKDLHQFSTGSGLAGTQSDWLVAVGVESPRGLSLINRALFDDSLSFSKDELRFEWSEDRANFAATYIWLDSDPQAGRTGTTSEMDFAGGYELRPGWRALAHGNYDFIASRAAKAGVGLQYRNECAAIDFSLSRRFTSSTSVTPTTSVGVAIRLSGFGSTSDGRQYRKSCGG